ncbi:MAG: rRNA maturation RNase YbeY [Solirubrobacterales bacterium]|nr:rRNA maturation RNase YbeY [Solirubrobacterales bacterium]
MFGRGHLSGAPSLAKIRRLCMDAADAAGVHDGHVAVEFVDEQRIIELNDAHRGTPSATDVLSFPIDGAEPLVAASPATGGPVAANAGDGGAGTVMRELGDIVICPAHTSDLSEAIVHGMLHLLGMDHEVDHGEMLALQRRLLQQAGR